jgi:N-acetylneuraminic acid mutarotase
MNSARANHTATLLPSGKVLVLGGGASSTYFNTAELYDPAQNTWATVANAPAPMISPRKSHTATLLPDGTVLVLGGQQNSVLALSSAERYDPAANTWTPLVAMSTARWVHAATLLPDGRVLVTGGLASSSSVTDRTAEVYDPASAQPPAALPMAAARAYHTATLLDAAGTVLVLGGTRGSVPEIWKP